MVSDEALVAAIPRDEGAFRAFYERHFDDVARYLVRRTGDAELAADLTAEVFATVLLQAGRFRPERGEARAWLFGIARHKQIDAYRRGRADTSATRRLGARHVRAAAEDLEALERLGAEIEAAISRLPAPQRRAVQGRLVDDLSYEELAAREATTPQAIRQRVSRGIAAVRSRLGAR